MVEDAFEAQVEALFNDAPAFADAEAFAGQVRERVARVRRAGRWVHGLAWLLGGAIAVLQLAQPSFWTWLGGAAGQGAASLDQAARASLGALSATPSPMFCAAVLGGSLLIAYLTVVLREN